MIIALCVVAAIVLAGLVTWGIRSRSSSHRDGG